MRLLLALPLLAACDGLWSPPTIDGLPAAEDPDIQYIEWMTLPPTGASAALVQQIIGDSDRRPVAFVGATWCGSCKAYKATLETEQMKSVHANVQILELDLDAHRALLAEMSIRPAGVPHWESLTDTGQSSGVRLDGRAWDTDTLDAMTPPLTAFFQALPDS